MNPTSLSQLELAAARQRLLDSQTNPVARRALEAIDDELISFAMLAAECCDETNQLYVDEFGVTIFADDGDGDGDEEDDEETLTLEWDHQWRSRDSAGEWEHFDTFSECLQHSKRELEQRQ